MKLSPYILHTDTDEGRVYYNTKNNHSFFISSRLVEKMKDDVEIQNQYESYLKSYHYNQEDNEFEKVAAKIAKADEKILEFTILTHGDCNFRCKYCYEKFEDIAMSEEVEQAISEFAEKLLSVKNYKQFHVHWFGGEPLLGYRTIKALSSKFQEYCDRYGVTYSSDITTNGFLLTRNKQAELIEKCSVTSFQITVDGDQEGHDSQRVLANGQGSYQRILNNLKQLSSSTFQFNCIIRFNLSESNLVSVSNFLDQDGKFLKNDERFELLFYNVSDWGQGSREKDYCVRMLAEDRSYEFARKAYENGYKLNYPESLLHNSFTCYANRLNHYMFNVRGIIQACTIDLYSSQNVFGNIVTKSINETKRKHWVKNIDVERCQDCPYVLICKSGHCPLVRNSKTSSWERLCQSNKRRIQKSLALFALTKEYNDVLDVL